MDWTLLIAFGKSEREPQWWPVYGEVKSPVQAPVTLLSIMRKRLKNKLRSCALCKPHKRGHSMRWRPQELQDLKATEREIREACLVWRGRDREIAQEWSAFETRSGQ